MSDRADSRRLALRYAAVRWADLSPPLGYPGGSCHLMERVREEAPVREQEGLIEKIEEGQNLTLSESSQIYGLEGERGATGSSFKAMVLKPHAQYRMDLRGVTVADLKRYFQNFQREWSKRKSKGWDTWEEAVNTRRKIEWTDPKTKLFVSFQPMNPKQIAIITAFWDPADRKPRPQAESSCDHWEGWAKDYPSGMDRLFPERVAARWAAAATGDCYEANGRFFMNQTTPFLGGSSKNMRLVHGEVTGQGPLEGVNYGHAWVEDGNTVIDVSNGKELRVPKALYYAIGGIERNDNLHTYSPEEFRRKVSRHEHWGPWDLRTSTGL